MRASSYITKGYTRVIFRMDQGEVLALFPDLPADTAGRYVTCYAHVGQHGAADLYAALRRSRPTTIAERMPLRRELTQIGYKLVERERYVRLKGSDHARP